MHALDSRPGLLRTPGESEGVWRGVQGELLDACAESSGAGGRLAQWRGVKLPQTVQVLLSALVIVADWIASNTDLFPYEAADGSMSVAGAGRVSGAWQGLGLPGPWRPVEPRGTVAELFAGRFDLPAGARVRPVQEAAVRMARELPRPGLLIVEAPMGEGKTEAALAVAEVFAARCGAGGVFFALPTMATGNAMFPRLLAWLDRLPHQGEGRLSVLLAHSKSALNEDFAALKAASWQRIAAVDVDGEAAVPAASARVRLAPAGLVAHQWLAGRKKGMLSSFVVGTIDQLLFAGLKSRHLALRHLAVAGKVVVIDEAHAYDTYMNCYLDRVLAWLGAYQVPAVVLSATLPPGRRRELAAAYAGVAADGEQYAALARADAYPLLTAVAPGCPPVQEAPGASGRGSTVQVECLSDDLDVLAERLSVELSHGGCVLVVRNTVARVLEAAKALRGRFGDGTQVTVAHARFLDCDRVANDARLLELFGPPGADRRRPVRHVVVASQVAEQSLDVDFDLLVTDLAPVDLVLQRMGRLHRHPREDRPGRLRVPRCLLTGVDWAAEPPVPVRGSARVYGSYALLRSLDALLSLPVSDEGGGRERSVVLPRDIPALVRRAYDPDGKVPQAWAAAVGEARAAHERARADQERRAGEFRLGDVAADGRSLVGWLAGSAGDADDSRAGRAQVRDGQESLEVVVVQRLADGSLATVDWAGPGAGLPLPRDAVPTAAAAKVAAACGLRLPLQLSHPKVIDQVIAELEQFYVPAWQSKDSHWLAGELILPIDADCRTRLAGFVLNYSRTEGLEVVREK